VNVHEAVAAVRDPEIRVLTIAELGILRDVAVDEAGRVTVTITPTYTGCPAMDVIRRDVAAAARTAGHADVDIRTVLSPPWTTDWIAEPARARLAAAGIAPPAAAGPAPPATGIAPPPAAGPAPPATGIAPPARATGGPVRLSLTVRCPRCGSPDTEQLSAFGSTACKALWRCRTCAEPFDAIKAH
jgi:ring-1,2-phenylacetyl-CoA epoxidase subunit PaaD